jgi:hypothetical protein
VEQLLGGENHEQPQGKELVVQLLESLSNEASPDSDWENKTLPDYLEALGALLGSIENSYINDGVPVPNDPWALMAAALRGARYYE